MGEAKRFEKLAWCFWAVVVLFCAWQRFEYGFEHDELEHLHYSWLISQGMVPFCDFFEHHPPVIHYLFSPFLSGQKGLSVEILIACRCVGISMVVALSLAHYRILAEMVPKWVAAAGISLPILICPFNGKMFDFRPDWLGLSLATWGLFLFYRSIRGAAHGIRLALIAGLLFGISAWTSQKTWEVIAACMAWGLAVALLSPSAERRTRWIAAGVCAGALLVSVSAVGLFFAAQGALGTTLWHVVVINLHWPQEIPDGWRYWWNNTIPYALGFVVVGFAEAIRTGLGLRRNLSEASMRSLLLFVLAAGIVAYWKTPVPWQQSLIFFVTIWLGLLAVAWVYKRASSRELRLEEMGLLVAIGIFSAMTLRWRYFAIVVVVWGIAGAIAITIVSKQKRDETRTMVAFAAALFAGAAIFLSAKRNQPGSHWREQLLAASRIAEFVKSGDRVIQVDLTLPFEKDVDYFWFAAPGVREQTDRAWSKDIDAGDVDLVIGIPDAAALPLTAVAMHRHSAGEALNGQIHLLR